MSPNPKMAATNKATVANATRASRNRSRAAKKAATEPVQVGTMDAAGNLKLDAKAIEKVASEAAPKTRKPREVAPPWDGKTARVLIELFYMKKEDMIAEARRLSMLEAFSDEEVAAMKTKDVKDAIQAAINLADVTLETRAAAEDTVRTKGDIERFFGLPTPPKGLKQLGGSN